MSQEKVQEYIAQMPEQKIFSAINQLEDMLSRSRSKNTNPENITFYEGVVNMLYQAAQARELLQFMRNELAWSKELTKTWFKRSQSLEAELQKYHTLEELQFTETLDMYRSRIQHRLQVQKEASRKEANT